MFNLLIAEGNTVFPAIISWGLCSGVTRDDSQRRFLTQHSVAILEQCYNYSKQCRNNVATLYCAKIVRCESSRVTSPKKRWLLKGYANL